MTNSHSLREVETKNVLITSQCNAPYHVDVKQFIPRGIVIFPGVFSPAYFPDSSFFINHLPINRGEMFLEVGSGSGICSVYAAIRGAKVCATDISKVAVVNTAYNALLNDVDVQVFSGDVLDSSVPACMRFDKIFCNPPFMNCKASNELELSVFDENNMMKKRLIEQAPKFLKKGGILYLGFSSNFGDTDFLYRMLSANNFAVKTIATTKVPFGEGELALELIEARIK